MDSKKKDGFMAVGYEDEKLMEVALRLHNNPQIYNLTSSVIVILPFF
jgi:hypothetical protein